MTYRDLASEALSTAMDQLDSFPDGAHYLLGHN